MSKTIEGRFNVVFFLLHHYIHLLRHPGLFSPLSTIINFLKWSNETGGLKRQNLPLYCLAVGYGRSLTRPAWNFSPFDGQTTGRKKTPPKLTLIWKDYGNLQTMKNERSIMACQEQFSNASFFFKKNAIFQFLIAWIVYNHHLSDM